VLPTTNVQHSLLFLRCYGTATAVATAAAATITTCARIRSSSI